MRSGARLRFRCPPGQPRSLSYPYKQAREFPRFHQPAESQRERLWRMLRVQIGTEHLVPYRENVPEVSRLIGRRCVMDAVKVRCHENVTQGADLHSDVAVFPELDKQANRVADTSLDWSCPEQNRGNRDL